MRLRSPALVLGAGWLVGLAVCGGVACSDFTESEAPVTAEAGPPADDGGGADAARTADGGPLPTGDAGTSAYRAAVLADGPLGYWRMGSTGDLNEVVDEVGNNKRPLFLQGGGYTLTAGAIASDTDDKAVHFSGDGGFGQLTDSTGLDFAAAAPFTLECWARRDAIDGGDYFRNLFGKIEGYDPNAGGYILYVSPGETGGQMASPDAAVNVFGPVVPAGVWAHYAMVFDGTFLRLFINAVEHQKKAIPRHLPVRAGNFMVGRDPRKLGGFWAGDIDELAIYPKALTAVELIEHYTLGTK